MCPESPSPHMYFQAPGRVQQRLRAVVAPKLNLKRLGPARHESEREQCDLPGAAGNIDLNIDCVRFDERGHERAYDAAKRSARAGDVHNRAAATMPLQRRYSHRLVLVEDEHTFLTAARGESVSPGVERGVGDWNDLTVTLRGSHGDLPDPVHAGDLPPIRASRRAVSTHGGATGNRERPQPESPPYAALAHAPSGAACIVEPLRSLPPPRA